MPPERGPVIASACTGCAGSISKHLREHCSPEFLTLSLAVESTACEAKAGQGSL